MKQKTIGQNKHKIGHSHEVCNVQNNKKSKKKREKSRLKPLDQTVEKESEIKSEKLRYKNADSIYEI